MIAHCSKPLLGVFASLLLVASAHAADDSLAGRWFTEGVENNVHLQVILETKPNGSYVKDVRAIDKCEVAGTGKETGTWTFTKGDLATTSEMLDGKPVTGSYADTHDLFNVTRIDEMHINLFDTETKITWGLTAVAQDYAFPPARGCSI